MIHISGGLTLTTQLYKNKKKERNLKMAYEDAWRVCHPDFNRPFSSLEDACHRPASFYYLHYLPMHAPNLNKTRYTHTHTHTLLLLSSLFTRGMEYSSIWIYGRRIVRTVFGIEGFNWGLTVSCSIFHSFIICVNWSKLCQLV